MSDTESRTTGNGLGFGTVLFFIFLVLKLTHVIAWSWWWVTAPLWIPAGFVAVLFVLAAIFTAVSK